MAEELEGYLKFAEKKKGKKEKEKTMWVIISGGALFYYKEAKDHKPAGNVTLQNAKVTEGAELSIEIVNKEGEFVLTAFEKDELKQWISAFQKATSLAPGGAPEREKKKKDGIMTKSGKNLVGKAATAGKEQLKKKLPQDLFTALETFLEMVKTGISSDKSKEMEKNLIKLMAKIFFQLERETLTMKKLQPILFALRDAFEAMALYQEVKGTQESTTKLKDGVKNVADTVAKIMQDFVKPDNLVTFRGMFTWLGSDEFLKLWGSGKEDALKVGGILRQYAKWEETFENCIPLKKSLGGVLVDDGGLVDNGQGVFRTEADFLHAAAGKGN